MGYLMNPKMTALTSLDTSSGKSASTVKLCVTYSNMCDDFLSSINCPVNQKVKTGGRRKEEGRGERERRTSSSAQVPELVAVYV